MFISNRLKKMGFDPQHAADRSSPVEIDEASLPHIAGGDDESGPASHASTSGSA